MRLAAGSETAPHRDCIVPPVRAFGLEFRGPVGLGAGLDRDGRLLARLEDDGFGFLELGTVTPEPVPGHNPGVDALAAELERYRTYRGSGPEWPRIGINLGRQPQHPLCEAAHDLAASMCRAWLCADYLAVNLTGPAARALLAAERQGELLRLLEHVRAEQDRLGAATAHRTPVLLKVPVVPRARLDHLVRLQFDGIIAVFVDERDGSPRYAQGHEVAGLACALSPAALIAGSGIRTAADAAAYLGAGAALVQVHRAYVERGARLVRAINRAAAAAGACSAPRVRH